MFSKQQIKSKPVLSNSIICAEHQLRWRNDPSLNIQVWYGTHTQRWQTRKWTAVPEVFFSAMLEQIGWEHLEERRAKARVIILHWIVHNFVDIPVSEHLTQAPTSRITGSFKCHVPYTRTLEYQHAFFTDSLSMWNNLPSDVMEAASLDLFKDQLANFTSWRQLQLRIYSHLQYSLRCTLTRPADCCCFTQYAMFYFRTLYLSEEEVEWA